MVAYRGMKPATAAERAHMARVKELPCLVCNLYSPHGICGRTEVHHIKIVGQAKSHWLVIPLGVPHHQTGSLNITKHRKRFEERYGTQRELWELTMATLGVTNVEWPQSKICRRISP
jgi:hypothetical protein